MADPRFKVTVTGIDYSSLFDLSHYNLDSLITTLREWFPSAQFEVEVQPDAPKPSN